MPVEDEVEIRLRRAGSIDRTRRRSRGRTDPGEALFDRGGRAVGFISAGERSIVRGATDADGRFAVEDLAPGDWQLEVRAPGYELDSRTVALTAGERTAIEDVVLDREETAEVHGTVSDARGIGVRPSCAGSAAGSPPGTNGPCRRLPAARGPGRRRKALGPPDRRRRGAHRPDRRGRRRQHRRLHARRSHLEGPRHRPGRQRRRGCVRDAPQRVERRLHTHRPRRRLRPPRRGARPLLDDGHQRGHDALANSSS